MSSPNRVLILSPGSGVAPVTTSESVTYNVNTEEITPDITSDHNKDQYGNPNQAIHQKNLYQYKAEWQLASSGTLPPTFGATFTRTVENEASSVTFVVLKAIVALRPARVVFVSCDPATFARDARLLVDGGFSLSDLTLFDLFPGTAHVESVGIFDRTD